MFFYFSKKLIIVIKIIFPNLRNYLQHVFFIFPKNLLLQLKFF